MIPGSAVYHVVEAMVPLYTAAVLGYASVRWLRAFSDEQCAGINHFVALYAIPALIFRMVATSDPYGMNGRLIAAATLQKAVILLSLCAWALLLSSYRRRRRHGGDGGGKASDLASPMKWVVTNFSAPTMSSTIIIGVPLLDGMYGTASGSLVAQLVLMQVCIWYNIIIIIFLYEYMAALDGGSAKISPEPPALVENCTRDNEGSNINDGVAGRSEIIMEVVVAPSTARDSPVAAEATTPAREVMMSSAGAAMTAEVLGVSPSVSKYVIWTAGKKLLKIPNTYASFLGLAWSLIASKCSSFHPSVQSYVYY
jgi:auxin efflux carrier family protein